MLLEGGHRLVKSNYTVNFRTNIKVLFFFFLENVIDMLRVERKWNLTKYKIITREDGKKRKTKEKMN